MNNDYDKFNQAVLASIRINAVEKANYVYYAGAGCGKTSTATQLVAYLKDNNISVQVTSFANTSLKRYGIVKNTL
eukprot:CAMPEP_0204873604 /NCGR_PEP_ID=MMETSP1348-20121228/41096_1 /ASSEMBLY_ACC=CAM_ASM_000700 /TAXON_ID=215587 /ORGANISM="Aplanochytrium stocchinoi, Strain GSBS06" /LENGTH=74 /DNA_ID=CAMNT_0052029029 /DNA_START=20 /DNA_END=241 /DNA_ORIENTATION=+